MNEDLISRKKAYEVLTEYYHHKHISQHIALREALDMVPPVDIDLSDYSDRLWRKAYEQGKADAEPRKKGKWEYNSPVTMNCDQCGYVIADWKWNESNFCANCGADMRGESE